MNNRNVEIIGGHVRGFKLTPKAHNKEKNLCPTYVYVYVYVNLVI